MPFHALSRALLGRLPVRRARRLESILSEGLAEAGVDAEAAVPPERPPVESAGRVFLTR